MESGNFIEREWKEAVGQGEQFLRGCGCFDAPDRLDCLRTKPIEALRHVHVDEFVKHLTYAPVVDGYEVDKLSEFVFAAGEQNAVPLMVGTNLNEGSYFEC